MSNGRYEYATALAEFMAEAQEDTELEGLELIDAYNRGLCGLLDKAREALLLAPEEERPEIAWKLYGALMQKNAEAMGAAKSQPFFLAPDCVHNVMNCWLTTLEAFPELAPGHVRSEVLRCEKMCRSAKKARLPGQRLVYKAYMANNRRVSYGEQFRERLKDRWE